MATYTLFGLLHQRSNRMDQLARYEAKDDSSAMELAGRLSRNRTTELWSEHRQVGKFGGLPDPMRTPKRAARHDPPAGRRGQGQVVASIAPPAPQADRPDAVPNGEAEVAAPGLNDRSKNVGDPAPRKEAEPPTCRFEPLARPPTRSAIGVMSIGF
jgi:hypothetical protein